MSLLSVHMDLGAACQQKQSSQSPEHVERQGDVMATGGRRFTLVRHQCNTGSSIFVFQKNLRKKKSLCDKPRC